MTKKRTNVNDIWPVGYARGEPWRDARTGNILAPGAVQAWPTPRDLRYIEKLYSGLRAEAAIKTASPDAKVESHPKA